MQIKQLRAKTGMSQREFSNATGIPLSSLQHWEQGYSEPPTYVLTLLEKSLAYDGLLTIKITKNKKG